ncbi:MAG: B12-binding domain-containing radical SAM protein [Campylobacterales bacterium]
MKAIVLSTLNARYSHASIALRYLLANLDELRESAVIEEFIINDPIQPMAEKILSYEPKIVGIGVYIWNARDVADLIEVIKKVSPQTMIILGGPEVSYEPFRVDWSLADYIIQGEGEQAFVNLCRKILEGQRPAERIIRPSLLSLQGLKLPYEYYNDEDVAHRTIYVEASRGCPFLCEFCLSSLDTKVRYFDSDVLLKEFDHLWARGVRTFKFIDRTFNLNIPLAIKLLDFFLSKEPPFFVHFEVIPDHFPEELKERLARFPEGSLQLEVGIQTLDPVVAATIRRPLRLEKIRENIAFLTKHTHAHLHLDLIVGLPGESPEGFGRNLNELVALAHGSEIQIGILKKLSGTTLTRHDQEFGMVYSDKPPYDLLANDLIPFAKMQELKRFARYWDIAYNSGNFRRSVVMLWLDGDVYKGFGAFAKWVYAQTASTWKFSPERFGKLLFDYLTNVVGCDAMEVATVMAEDFSKSGKKVPIYLREVIE